MYENCIHAAATNAISRDVRKLFSYRWLQVLQWVRGVPGSMRSGRVCARLWSYALQQIRWTEREFRRPGKTAIKIYRHFIPFWIVKLHLQGQMWIHYVQLCLTGEIYDSDMYTTIDDTTSDPTTCFNLRKLAFDSYSRCFLFDDPVDFCTIVATSPQNLNGLFRVLQDGPDFPGPYWRQAWTEVFIIRLCCGVTSIAIIVHAWMPVVNIPQWHAL